MAPAMPHLRSAILEGHVRICPVCEGYEMIDKDVAVFGPADRAAEKALFLRPYTNRLTVLLPAGEKFTADQRAQMRDAIDASGVRLPCRLR
jgi:thioredoxin reductase (NADPH)